MALRHHDLNHLGNGGSNPALDDAASLARLLGHGADAAAAGPLLHEFRSLDVLLAATPESVGRFADNRTVALLAAARDVMLRSLRPAAVTEPVLDGTSRVLDYLRALCGASRVEELHVLYLDRALKLLRHEIVARGGRDRVVLEPREVIRRALDLGADAVLLAHNHPSGSVESSLADLNATRRLAEAARVFEIRIVDHLIVGTAGAVSMRAEGRI